MSLSPLTKSLKLVPSSWTVIQSFLLFLLLCDLLSPPCIPLPCIFFSVRPERSAFLFSKAAAANGPFSPWILEFRFCSVSRSGSSHVRDWTVARMSAPSGVIYRTTGSEKSVARVGHPFFSRPPNLLGEGRRGGRGRHGGHEWLWCPRSTYLCQRAIGQRHRVCILLPCLCPYHLDTTYRCGRS